MDRALQVNAAAFYYDYRDKQFLAYFPTVIGVQQGLSNVPKSKEEGGELSFVALPMSNLTLRAAVTYIHTQIGAYTGYGGTGTIASLSGNPFNFAPAWTGNGDAEYRFNVTDGLTGFVGVGEEFSGATYADLGMTPSLKLNSYALLDARIGVTSASGWNASFWGRFTGLPRTFGITIGYKF
jgi:outer membrane receptor protein involved in Fe transport